jgi:hypothetical protein
MLEKAGYSATVRTNEPGPTQHRSRSQTSLDTPGGANNRPRVNHVAVGSARAWRYSIAGDRAPICLPKRFLVANELSFFPKNRWFVEARVLPSAVQACRNVPSARLRTVESGQFFPVFTLTVACGRWVACVFVV